MQGMNQVRLIAGQEACCGSHRGFAGTRKGPADATGTRCRSCPQNSTLRARLTWIMMRGIPMRARLARVLLLGWVALGLGAAAPAGAPADVVVPALDGTLAAPLAPADDVEATVLLFVMSDCPISNRYAPEVRRIHDAFAGRVAFWLVYVDADRPVADLAEHRASFGYPFTAVRDAEGALAAAAGATVTPEAAVWDAAGRLVYRGRIDDRFVSFGVTRAAPTTRDLHGVLERIVAGERVPFQETRAIGCYIPDAS